MNGEANRNALAGWAAITTGLVVCGVGLEGLLLQVMRFAGPLATNAWELSPALHGLARACIAQVTPLLFHCNLAAAGLLLAFYGLQRLPLRSARMLISARRQLS